MAGTEVIDGNFNALFMQPVELRQRIAFFHHTALGNFKYQREVVARQLRQQFVHVLMERGRTEMRRGDVQTELGALRQRRRQPGGVFGNQAEQVTRQRHYQPFAFGVGNKQIRRNTSFDRVLPADQRFQPTDGAGFGMKYRLILDKELVAFDAAHQGALRALAQQQHVVAQHADH
ncbi:hypothetical protein D3C78_1037480 [compost metagenome]